MSYTPTIHPHALTAVMLASFNRAPDRAWIGHMLATSGCPRRLYDLAVQLRAAHPTARTV